jgi:hypothetical protein
MSAIHRPESAQAEMVGAHHHYKQLPQILRQVNENDAESIGFPAGWHRSTLGGRNDE